MQHDEVKTTSCATKCSRSCPISFLLSLYPDNIVHPNSRTMQWMAWHPLASPTPALRSCLLQSWCTCLHSPSSLVYLPLTQPHAFPSAHWHGADSHWVDRGSCPYGLGCSLVFFQSYSIPYPLTPTSWWHCAQIIQCSPTPLTIPTIPCTPSTHPHPHHTLYRTTVPGVALHLCKGELMPNHSYHPAWDPTAPEPTYDLTSQACHELELGWACRPRVGSMNTSGTGSEAHYGTLYMGPSMPRDGWGTTRSVGEESHWDDTSWRGGEVRVCLNGGVDVWEDSHGGAVRIEGAEVWEE